MGGLSSKLLGVLGRGTDRLPRCSLVWIALCLGGLSVLPGQAAWLCLTAVIVVFGVPHGALDGEVARPILQPKFGRAWFLAFAPAYLALSAAVLLAWRIDPTITLAAFLALSVLHFGMEDTAPASGLLFWIEVFVRGGLPIALPLLLRPAATTAVFAAATQVPLSIPVNWLWVASLLWAAATITWIVVIARQGLRFSW